MRRSEWVVLSLILLVAFYFVFWIWVARWDHVEGRVLAAIHECKRLAVSAEAYRDHPDNTGHLLPGSVTDLIRPPWGGNSLYPGYAKEPVDPWGKPYQVEPRKWRDGTDYLFFWTTKPDGTRISQFGVGKHADPEL